MAARARTDRSTGTRDAILTAAERLFAEHGVHAVSNRTIADAAGQGNTAVVGYHFGTKTDLVRAIVARHAAAIEATRARMVAELDTELDTGSGDRAGVRDWVACIVRPLADHLEALGSPTWYARFSAQVMTDPALREMVTADSMSSPTLRRIIGEIDARLPALPPQVRLERGDIARHLLVPLMAERERALADGSPTPRATWHDAATGLVDALVGVWLAPVS